MNMKKIILFAGMLLITSAGIINAQTTTRSNKARHVTQQARIADGIHDKELTKKETARLEREQRKINIEKRIANADGTVTPREKKFLRREQNRASRHIHRQKNDKQIR
jgi:hypothetical protein